MMVDWTSSPSPTAAADLEHKGNFKRRRGIDWSGYAYILPLYALLGAFIFWGIGYNFYISFFKWDGIGDKKFIGLRNYTDMVQDPLVHDALQHTLQFLLVSIPGSMLIGFVMAILLHSVKRLVSVAKALFFLPYVMAVVVIGITFQMIYEPNFGLLNETLRAIGLDALTRQWIGSKETALNSLAAVYIYGHVGFYMLLYYTSILNIDGEVFEAARIDGAGLFRQSTRIIFPMLKGTHMTLMILGVIAALKVFELVWVMTVGGPGGATELISTLVFKKALLEFNQGYSAAISVLMVLIAFVYTAFQVKSYNKARR
ncbi:carbohydrate ABC transporter permease [Paenibacillus koleovorans]|uniref:carbohydrate ABC transporter permease n=1 Tax=Paenibacillus koleovorans TaxID=121608 RepID=UPI000FDAC3EE|nr:sugar ABC transporter permease [Paenibacillus koleovorans]